MEMARAPGPVVRQEILRLTSPILARGGFETNAIGSFPAVLGAAQHEWQDGHLRRLDWTHD